MRIDINLASHPYEDSRRFWTYWGTGIALLFLATALLVFLAMSGFLRAGVDRHQISRLKSEIAAYDQEKVQAEALLNQPPNRVIRERSKFLNQLFERKAFSWTRVFEDLERVMPAHLHVVSIHPDLSAENSLALKLVVGGDSREQAMVLLRKMEESNRFKQTRIDQVKFGSEQGNNSGDRVQFDITAFYIPSADAGQVSGGMN
jgi:type IV pilus assembly protein PilN